jgi:hypothetical protein
MKDFSLKILPLLAAAFLAGCSSGTDQPLDVQVDRDLADPEVAAEAECAADPDCDDGFDCTVDSCAVGGVCSHTPIHSLCAEGQRCEVGRGCIDIGCTSDADCNDDIDCTQDICGAGGACANVPLDSRCGPDETCSPTLGCITPCMDDPDCANGIFCDGVEQCHFEFGCQPGEPRDCNDNDPCTEDFCDTVADACVNTCVPSATCTCPFLPSEAYNACYSLSAPVQESCAMAMFNFTVSQVCFTLTGSALQAQATPFRGAGATLTQIFTEPPGPDFDVTYVISGGCEEQYGMTGTFTDNAHFDGTWTSNFIDHDGFSCMLGGCPNQAVLVTGTKIP